MEPWPQLDHEFPALVIILGINLQYVEDQVELQ